MKNDDREAYVKLGGWAVYGLKAEAMIMVILIGIPALTMFIGYLIGRSA